MELNAWVRRVGGIEKAAVILKEKPRTVYSWFRMDRVPNLDAALNIVIRTQHAVDYNGIYGPLAESKASPK